MAWNDVASNQMVSYFDASTSGIPLLSGQSHFTTLPDANQCMDKTAMQAKYNLNATNLNTYASNQLVPKSAWATGVVTPRTNQNIDTTHYGTTGKYASYLYPIQFNGSFADSSGSFVDLYSDSSTLAIGSTIYPNFTGGTAFNGQSLFYQYGGGKLAGITNPLVYQISSSGVILAIYNSVYETSPTHTPPSAPTNFTGQKFDTGVNRYAIFQWTPSTDNDMIHHYVLKYTESGGFTSRSYGIGYTPNNTFIELPTGITNYPTSDPNPVYPLTSLTLVGGKYNVKILASFWGNHGTAPMNWHVTAVDISGNESGISNVYNMGSGVY